MGQGGWGQGGYGPPPAPGGYGPPPTGHGFPQAPMAMMAPAPGQLAVPSCRHCGAMTFPVSKISTSGWIVFFGLLIFCFPLCWIGLLMKETGRRCGSCQVMAGPMG